MVYGSFLAGAIISLLIPVGLLIAIALWHARAFMRVPADPAQSAAHAAGPAEREGAGAIQQNDPNPAGPRP
jgi:hypothetical protein